MITVEQIGCIKQWLRDIQAGEVKVGYLTEDHFRTLNAKAAQVNREWSENGSNRWSHYATNAKGNRVCVVCITDEEREQEKTDINHANDWKKKIPKYFFSKDVWEVGSKHD